MHFFNGIQSKCHFYKESNHKKIDVEKKELTIEETKEICKKYKSQFLDTLCLWQIENYKVVCCIEHRINTNGVEHLEYSFIFTIKENSKKLYLAYENTANSRSTYIIPISIGTWEKSIELIYQFFASSEINKRQLLAAKIIDLKLPGDYEYKRILHTNYSSWVNKTQSFLDKI